MYVLCADYILALRQLLGFTSSIPDDKGQTNKGPHYAATACHLPVLPHLTLVNQ